MKKMECKLRKLLRTLFGCLSFTAVAFVFQACYGPYPAFYDIKLSGTVKAKNSNNPIPGIKVVVNDGSDDFGLTDNNGNFNFYTRVPNHDYYVQIDSTYVVYTPDSVKVHFLDVDGLTYGAYENKTVIVNPEHLDEVKVFVQLDEK